MAKTCEDGRLMTDFQIHFALQVVRQRCVRQKIEPPLSI